MTKKCVVFVLFMIFLEYAWAQSYGLRFTNVPPDIQAEVLERYKSLVPNGFTFAQVDDIIRSIHLKTNNELIEMYLENDTIVINLVKSTRIKNISIEGNRAHSDGQLKNILGFSEGDILDTDSVLEGAEKVRKFYIDSGFLNATVNVEIPDSVNQNVNVDITIVESNPTRIRSIEIKTSNIDLKSELGKKLKKFEKNYYTDELIEKLKEEVKDYFQDNKVLQGEVVKIETGFSENDSAVNLVVHLNNTNKFSFDFVGYNEFSRYRLNRVLDVDNYASTNPNVSAELAFRLKNFYLGEGYARVEIQSELQEPKKFERKVLFKINEGPKVHIEKIFFQGNFKKESRFYEKLFAKVSEDIISDRIYVREALEKVVANFEIEMQNQGYLAFDVPSFRTVYNAKKDKISLYVNIEEGPLTIVESLAFEGNNSIPNDLLMSLIDLKKGQPLELSKLERSIGLVKNYYQEQGYLEVAILNEKDNLVTYNSDNTKAQLFYRVYEGPKVRVASIATEGNLYSKDEIILIELEFKRGDILTPSKLEESVLRLQKTGYFNTVEIRTLEQRTSVADRTVVVKVTERDPGTFTMGFGATNERNGTLRGYTGLGYRNLMGTGRGVSSRFEGNYNIADIKYPELRVIFGYVEPYLFESRLRGRVNVSRSRYVSDLDVKQGVESNQYIYALEKDFTSHVTGIFEIYNLEQYRDFFLRDDVSTPDENETNKIIKQQNIASIGPTIDIDFRDNPFLPTKGIFARLNLEYSNPALGSSDTIEYVRFMSSFTHYWPFIKNWVWAHNLRYGYLENLNKNPDGGVPYSKKGFILGGGSTIRGFRYRAEEFLPSQVDLGVNPSSYSLTTNAQQYLFKSEVRFPIHGNIYGGVFYDGGAVVIKDLKQDDVYRDSVGVGLRYNTIMGALNMEFGYKLDRKPGDEPYEFHLSFGTF
ncbi:MAG: BamA/TamA family outer membrane protein [Bdellovibrionaceae bacterium]|nr:BamA/TamA family outer membrane protein [Pseudobdellovibrionaceae bacterium]